MIKDFVQAWNANKSRLESYMRTHNMNEFAADYDALVSLLFTIVINPYLEEKHGYNPVFDTNKITVIDDGDYQGTQLFLIPRDTYQPSEDDYVMTHCNYGSCSGCDTLLSITLYDSHTLPNDGQVSELMLLCLHLLQRCVYPFNDEK